MSFTNFNKRQDDDDVNVNNSTITTTSLIDNNSTSTAATSTIQHKWIMCDEATAVQDTATLGYNCEKRPYMNIILLVSILVFIILRQSNFIKKFFSSNDGSKEAETDEEEGLMQRVF